MAVALGMVASMVVCAALLTATTSSKPAELIAVAGTPDGSLDQLAMRFLKNAATMQESQMLHELRVWRDNPETMLSSLDPSVNMGSKQSADAELSAAISEGARTEMLVGGLRSRVQILGASDSKLCAKKDIIIKKFDDLLRKLGGEELALNISLGKMSAQWHAAMEGWLDSESQYRLRIEQAKEARQGSKFAEEEYEKYRQAQKEAEENYNVGKAKHDKEREELDGERALIKMIMRYIGVLHDVKATEKSIAAGGRDSIKDEETGVSDYYGEYKDSGKTRAELKAKIAKLTELLEKQKLPGTTQKLALLKAHTSKLAVYAETIEVVNILKEMLEDIKTRFEIIDKVDNEAKKLMDDVTAKMVEWEGKLVALGNAKDKAKALQDAAKLEREKLNGDNHVIEVAATEDRKAAKVMIPPYEREIYVITMIKKKIIDKCAAATE